MERKATTRCAIYTRKSSEEGLSQAFNSLHAQREYCEAYIKSQGGEGWAADRRRYDDGGFSSASTARPGLKRLLADVEAGSIDAVVVYKVDRLTRSLADFARILEALDKRDVAFVSVIWSCGEPDVSALHADNRALVIELAHSMSIPPDFAERAADALLVRVPKPSID